jgi:imidazolonepropionase-like amidohydrolase
MGAEEQHRETSRLLITATHCFDGAGGVTSDAGVVVVDGKIEAFGGRTELEGRLDADGPLRHFEGCTLLPGLIDTHTHLVCPGDGTDAWAYCDHPDGVLLMTAARNAWRSLRAGFTTVADLGARGDLTFQLRTAVQRGLMCGPRLVLAGYPLTITGGHCWPLGGEADGVDEVRRSVRRLCKMGADLIKVMLTGGGTPGTNSRRPAYSRGELEAIVDEAHARDRLVVGHSGAITATEWALDAGFDVIAHCHFQTADGDMDYDEALGARIAERGVFVNPTLQVNRVRLTEPVLSRRADELDDAALDEQRRRYAQSVDNFNALRHQGVRLVCGSDSGWGWSAFGDNARELEAMVEAGMGVREALVSATSAAADSLGLEDVGSLDKGKVADLVVVRGNALEDVGALANVQSVWVRGEEVDRTAPFPGEPGLV